MILGILLGTGSLAVGYYQVGMFDVTRWSVLLGFLWILAHWRKYYWFSALAFFLILIGAAYGVWHGYLIAWMMLGALGGLLGWDSADFAQRLSYAAPTDDVRGMEHRHLARVAVVVVLGFGLAWLSLVIHVQQLAFEVAVGLVLVAAVGLTRLVIRLRK